MISTFGYTGIFLTMAIESACIPLPSEIIMPFSGYLVTTGQFTMLGVTLAGAIGNVAGSVVAYYAGVWGGRPFVERYGPYVLVSQKRHRDGGSMVREIWRCSGIFQPDASGRPDLHLVAGRHRQSEYLSVHALHVSRCIALVLSSGLYRRENGRAVGASERLFPSVRHRDRRLPGARRGLFSLVSLAEAPHHSGVVTSPCSRSTTRSPGKKSRSSSLQPKTVRMYVCGVTVYDYCHIGHARSALVFDVIRRYLEFSGYQVEFVKNFTDVDDKIIKRANERGVSLRRDHRRNISRPITRTWGGWAFSRASNEPKATEHMTEIIRSDRDR